MNYKYKYEKHCCDCKMNYSITRNNYKKHCCKHKNNYENKCYNCVNYNKIMIELKYHPRNVAKFLEENDIDELDNM
jgi:hypothetical protein